MIVEIGLEELQAFEDKDRNITECSILEKVNEVLRDKKIGGPFEGCLYTIAVPFINEQAKLRVYLISFESEEFALKLQNLIAETVREGSETRIETEKQRTNKKD